MSEPVKCFRTIKEAVQHRKDLEAENPGKLYAVDNTLRKGSCVEEVEHCAEGTEYAEAGGWFSNPNLKNAWQCSDALNRVKSGQTGQKSRDCHPQTTQPHWVWNKHYKVVCDEPKKD